MTHKEATKNLMELQIRLINDNSEEATEYNKKICDTLTYFITQTIPSSVIEDIKAEIKKKHDFTDAQRYSTEYYEEAQKCRGQMEAYTIVLEIIDKEVKECTHE